MYTVADADGDCELIKQGEDISYLMSSASFLQDSDLKLDLPVVLKSWNFLRFAHEALDADIKSVQTKIVIDDSAPLTEFTNNGNCATNGILVELPALIHVKNQQPLSLRDSSLQQLEKDVKRDKFLVNGTLFIGAATGVQGMVEIMSKSVEQLCHDCCIPLLGTATLTQLFHISLSKACRTNSGVLYN